MVSTAPLDAAGRAAIAEIAEHMRGAGQLRSERYIYQEWLPRLGRRDAVRAMDAQLQLAAAHAHTAVALLDDLGHPALREIRDGVEQLGRKLDERLALPHASRRWVNSYMPGLTDELARHGATTRALEAIGGDTAPTWLAERMYGYTPAAEDLALQRTVATIDPSVAHVAPWIPSKPVSSWYTTPYSSSIIEPLIRENGDKDDAVIQAFWQWQHQTAGRTFQMPADDLRRIYESLRRANHGAANPAPEWLMTPAADERVEVTPERLATLSMLARGLDRTGYENLVAHALITDLRMSIFPGQDYGALIVRAARELPPELRPVVPARAEEVPTLALSWARRVRERTPRAQLAESTAPPAQQILDILANGGDVTAGINGRTRVALELVRDLQPETEGGRQVRSMLLNRLVRNTEQYERAWHVDYVDHGRAIALADTLAALERTPAEDVSRIADDMATDVARVTDTAATDRLAW